VLRFAFGRSAGSGKRLTSCVTGSTRTIALRPPSVTPGAPSGPTITPCGAEPAPSLYAFVTPNLGSSHPSSPDSCAVYQTPPSRAGATSCGPWPRGTLNSCITNSSGRGEVPGGGGGTVAAGVFGGAVGASVRVAAGPHANATRSAAV